MARTKNPCCSSSIRSAAEHDLGWPRGGYSKDRTRKKSVKEQTDMCSPNGAERVVSETTDLVGIITSDTYHETTSKHSSSDRASTTEGRGTDKSTIKESSVGLSKEQRDHSEGTSNNMRFKQHYRAPLEDILQNRARCPPNLLKKRLIHELKWERKCSSCRLTKWLGDPIALKLNHNDGNVNNNNLNNLSLLCANCYCQLLFNSSDESDGDESPSNKESRVKNQCKDCGHNISSGATRCIDCNGKRNRKTNRPSKEQLIKDKKQLKFFTKIGAKYGVSDNSIRKWFRKYGIQC